MDGRAGDLPGDDQPHPTGSQDRRLRDSNGSRDADGSENPSRRSKKRQIIVGLSFLIILLILMPFVSVSWGFLLKPLAISALARLLSILRFIVMTSAVSAGIITTSHHNSDDQSSTKGNSVPRRNPRNDEKGKGPMVVNGNGTPRISSGMTLTNAQSRSSSVLDSRGSHPESGASGKLPSSYQIRVPPGVGKSTKLNAWESLGLSENVHQVFEKTPGLHHSKPETLATDSVREVDPSEDSPKSEQADLSTDIGRRHWAADNSPRGSFRNKEQSNHNEQGQNLQTDQQANYYRSTRKANERRRNGRGNLSPSARSRLQNNAKHSRSEENLDKLLEKAAMKPSVLSQAPPRRQRQRPTSISYDFDHDIGRTLRHLAPPPETVQHQSSFRNLQSYQSLLGKDELAPWRATPAPQTMRRSSSDDDLSPPADVKAENAELEKRFEQFIAKAHEQWLEERQASLERHRAFREGRDSDTDSKGKSPL